MSGADGLDDVRRRHRDVHGDAPLSPADQHALASRLEPVTDAEVLAGMAAGRLPLPPYLLPDGTPLAPGDHLDPVGWTGGAGQLHDWYVAYWPDEERADAERAFAEWMAGRHGWLATATPHDVRRLARWQDRARAAVARLEADPRDPDGRGALAEAVEELDGLLAPVTDGERDRHGGTHPREEWVDRLRREHLTHTVPDLPLRTDRLLLRRPVAADADAVHGYHGREDVAAYLLSEAVPRAEVPDRIRHWDSAPERVLTLVVELEGRVVGDVQLILRGPSTAEIGWAFHPEVGGRGVATEAAGALLGLAFGHYGLHRVHAELDARNTASARLCERLGMRRETHRLRDYWSKGEWTDTLAYAVLVEEWREAHPDGRMPPRSPRG